MKKLLTILILLLTVISIRATEVEETLWEDAYTDGIELNNTTVATFNAGDKLRVYLTVPSAGANFKIVYKGSPDWSETTIPSIGNQWPWVNGEETYKEFALTEADITAFSEKNIYIYKGENSVITKVSLITEDSPSSYEGTVIYNDGDVIMGTAWDKCVQLSKEKFSNLNPGAVIRVYIKDVLDDVQAIFQDGDWQDIEGVDAICPAATDTYYELTLTSSVLDVVKAKGLIIKGKNFTATAVTIMSTGTAVTKYTLTIIQPSEGGKIKNGDADAETNQYESGSVVTLTVSAAEGYIFEKWTDGTDDLIAESDGSLKVTMDADKSVSAVFEAIPVVTPVFTDGVADLSKFEVQDAEKVTYDTESHKITVTEGWTGVQITATTADDVQGKELRITFSDVAKVKATVKYADETATDTIMADFTDILYMVIDGTKKVSQIQIQPTDAGSITLNEVIVNAESTKPADPVITPVFTDGVADLSKFEVQDAEKVTYDTESHKITVTEGWIGIQLSATTADDVQGKELRITFSDVAKVKATVKYADETATDTIMSDVATTLYMVIDGTKKISQIQIQPTDAGSITLNEVIVNAESTKPADPVITPVFTDGVADLSKFEVQDAEKVTYDTESHKITVTEGWIGVQLSATTADDVQGKELRITFSDVAKVKATVKYADETATDTIMSDFTNILYMVIDGTKKVSQIQIQPTDAGSVTLSEVIVNAESTKPADPVITPVFTDGVADLSKFEVQDAEKVTYDTESHKITVTEGWIGVQLSATTADDVQGKELRITFSDVAKVKATVKYADETATDTIMADFTDILYMVIDGTKKVSQIQIQPTDAGSITLNEVIVNAESTKPVDPVVTPLFDADGKADLSKFEVQDAEKVTYNTTSHKITVTEGWVGVQATITDGEEVSGKELRITFSKAAKVKVSVSYTDETSAEDVIMSDAATVCYFPLDNTKKVYQIQIQPTEAGSVTLSEVIVNAESTKPVDPVVTPLFDEEGKADLSKFEVQDADKVTYNTTSHKITVTEGWVGVQATITDGEEVSGKELRITFSKAAKVKVSVSYTDETSAEDVIMSDAATVCYFPLDNTKKVYQIQIQPTEAGSVTLSEVIVNAESTKPVDPVVTPLFDEEGKADLSKFEVQDADKVTYNTTNHKITVTEGWVGVQATITDGEEVSGKELRITFSKAAKVKVSVSYTDETSAEDVIMSDAATVCYFPLDNTKKVYQIQIQPTEAGSVTLSEVIVNAESTKPVDPVVTPLFDEEGKADLSKFEVQDADKVTYNTTSHKITVTEGWVGVQATITDGEEVSGKELRITFSKAAKVKVSVSYTDETSAEDVIMSDAATVCYFPLDNTKKVYQIQIQPTEAGSVTLSEVIVNAESTKPVDPEPEPIIDEETGEADLTQLSAQDDTKTTLTQNEDGTITMTTTEPYCAAQIWFDDPETLTGNVLKVELAESNVNVTVTVKYTDGTESQMSANTMVAKARAATRSAASGTMIEVPLETGKEVQNIEVKNNVAGTITIKKMQVTTINVFTDGEANLSMLKPQSNATYDTSTHTLATTKGWTGATISPIDSENVSGKELLIEFAEPSRVKVSVIYRTDEEGPSRIMDKAATSVRLALDNTKQIQEISIQPTEAAIVTFKKIAVNSEESDDGTLKPGKSITLWENAAGETLAWNEIAHQDATIGEMLQEYDELLITVSGVTEGCDWPKVFIRDADSEQAGNEVLLNDVGSFPYTVRIVLTGEMADQLADGFCICGDGVTVTKLVAYRPEAPKPGDIHLIDLNYGYNSSYDKGTHTITTTSRWAARGWEIGDKRYNDKNLITVKFEPVDFPVTLKMEYTTGLQTAQATSVGVPAGRTELLLEIPSGISKLNRVYIIYENPGSVKLTEASVTYQEKMKLSTAIEAFEAEGVIHDGRYDTDGWYNLRGIRIPEPKTSGIYIHGGKKVVIN